MHKVDQVKTSDLHHKQSGKQSNTLDRSSLLLAHGSDFSLGRRKRQVTGEREDI